MTNYSNNPGMVRVDYFKPGGKWYMTEAHNMYMHWGTPSVHTAIEEMLVADGGWRPHFTIVVLEPYHQHAHPVMIPASVVME